MRSWPREASLVRGVPPACSPRALVACEDVTPTVWTRAPGNLCPEHACDRYEQDGTSRPQCSDGRCEVLGRPDYPITLVIDVPDSSFFGAGHTFVLRSGDPPNLSTMADCPAATCLRLPPLVAVGGSYAFTSDAARRVGQPFGAAESSLPATVRLAPLAVQDEPLLPSQLSLPLEPLRGQTGAVAASPGDPLAFEYVRNLPAGRYLRVVEPARPLDEAFPPFASQLDVLRRRLREYRDDVLVGGQDLPLDDQWVARTATDGPRRVTRRLPRVARRRPDRAARLIAPQPWCQRVRLDTVGGRAGHVRPETASDRDGAARRRRGVRLVSHAGGGSAARRLPGAVGAISLPGHATRQVGTGAQAEVTFSKGSAPRQGRRTCCSSTSGRGDGRPRCFATVLQGRHRRRRGSVRGLARTSLELGVETASAAVELVPARRTASRAARSPTDARSSSGRRLPLPGARIVAGHFPVQSRFRADEDGRFVADVDPGEHDVAVVPQTGRGCLDSPRTSRSAVPRRTSARCVCRRRCGTRSSCGTRSRTASRGRRCVRSPCPSAAASRWRSASRARTARGASSSCSRAAPADTLSGGPWAGLVRLVSSP